ncbi:MAG: flagellar biosynthesis protein FlhF [Nitrosospira sp.]|nr:flagellar biosynthesis protein FlhF [Nitrosospira sp.]
MSMNIKRFFAKTTRDALHMVRNALGPDGAILSNRTVDGGIEILALSPNDVTALMPPPAGGEAKAASTPGGKALGDEPRGAGSHGNEPHGAERPGQTQAIVPPAGKNFPEREAQAGTGFKDLPPLHFPAFGRQRERQAERRTIPDLSDKSRQARSRMLLEAHQAKAAPGSVNGGKERQSAMPLRRLADPLAAPMADRVASRLEPVKDTAAAESAARAKKRRSAINPRKKNDPVAKVARVARIPAVPAKKKQSGFDPRQVADEVAANVLNEIKSMRGTLEQQLAVLSWNEQQRRDPARVRMLGQLLAAGFSASLARDLLTRLPVGQPAQEGQQEEKYEKEAMNWIKTVLAGNLQTIGDENEMLEKGGVFALVGPTGVGKTTTTAKLAARCVVRHGSDKLALLTTDGYRIGGHEQLRIYGKILGVSVYAVKDAQDLTLALAELRGKHMVLIDTVGMGQRDRMVAEQVAMLTGCGAEVKRLLLLNAASSGDTLNEVVHAYQGDGLAGAIITKLDEAVTMGCALDTAIRHQLPLYYVATGQRVPEDLHLADPVCLINDAFDNLPAASPFAVPEHAFPLLMPGFQCGSAQPDMAGARLG